jgi:hypothetical protein
MGTARHDRRRTMVPSQALTDSKVAAYMAKYATNAAECTGTLDPAPGPTDRLADLPVGVETGIMRST